MNETDRQLIDRLFDEDLPAGEGAALLERMEGDREAVAYLAKRASLHAGLRQVLKRQALGQTALVAATRVDEDSASNIIVMPRPRFRRVIASWAAAAGIVFAAIVAGVFLLSQSSTSAAAVVQLALKAQAALLDRCYRVEVRGERDVDSPPRRQSLLWTRGDRFWNQFQADGKTVAWGRDEAGGVWFALSPKVGARLAAAEVPGPLQTACELRSVQMETLLREILAGYELRRESVSRDRDLIHAQPKPGTANWKYSAVLLEVDSRTHVVQRVELRRTYEGRVIATATLALIESRLQDDASYTLEGHLDPDGVVLDRSSARGQRVQMLAEFMRLVRVRPAGARVPPQQ